MRFLLYRLVLFGLIVLSKRTHARACLEHARAWLHAHRQLAMYVMLPFYTLDLQVVAPRDHVWLQLNIYYPLLCESSWG